MKFNMKPIINYRFGLIYPSDSIAVDFKKNISNLKKFNTFMYHLWSTRCEVLIRIQPHNHPRHFVIWSPWTKAILIMGKWRRPDYIL